MAMEIDAEPTVAEATRAGELALLLSSIGTSFYRVPDSCLLLPLVVSVIVGTVLPYLAQRDSRLLSNKLDEDEEDEDEEISRIRAMVRSWKAEAARMGRPLHLPAMPFMLRNVWTGGLLLFGLLMMSTFFVRTVWQATLVVALAGISWAIACWVPFAIIMEVSQVFPLHREFIDNTVLVSERSRCCCQGSSCPRTELCFSPPNSRSSSILTGNLERNAKSKSQREATTTPPTISPSRL